MQIIPRHIHGILDYLVGLFLVFAPQIFGFDTGGIEQRISITLGLSAVVHSFVTNYELGLVKLLPFKLHLALDAASGLLLASSPWLFHFSDRVWIPHVALGAFEIVAVLITRTTALDGVSGSPRTQA